jgi:simple sugar transport system permease protein
MNKTDQTVSQREKKVGTLSRFYNNSNCISHDSNLIRLFFITIVIFIVMSLLKPDLFLTMRNFSSMSFQFPEYGILAIAMMITMITGGIDLSVVGVANLSAILSALVLTRLIPQGASGGYTILMMSAAIVLSIGTGVICGLLNGFFIAKVGITPILATLGTMQLFTGIAIVITKGSAIYGFPDQYLLIGNGSLWVIPIPLIIFALIALAFTIILNKTAFGYKVFLMGTNPSAAHFSGINNKRVLIRTYIMSGLLAAMAGIIMIARTNSAKADYGTSYTLEAILIAVLGGVNPNGGFGTIAGLVLAILSLQFLSSGFNMLRFSNFFKEFIWGAVLLIVMVINYYSNKKSLRSSN